MNTNDGMEHEMRTLKNSFHNTYTTTFSTKEDLERSEARANAGDASAKRYLRSIRSRLCGSPTCTCSGLTGERK